MIDTQLSHNAWAIRELIDRCRRLTPEQYRQSHDIGFRTLERSLAHIIDCMYYFADAFAGKEYEERADLEEGAFEPEELETHLARAEQEVRSAVEAFVEQKGVAGKLEFPVGSGRWTNGNVVLAQTFDHGTHHRAQCLWMLKQLSAADGLELHPLRWAGID